MAFFKRFEPSRGSVESPPMSQDVSTVSDPRKAIRLQPAFAAEGAWVVTRESEVLSVSFDLENARKKCQSIQGVTCDSCATHCDHGGFTSL